MKEPVGQPQSWQRGAVLKPQTPTMVWPAGHVPGTVHGWHV